MTTDPNGATPTSDWIPDWIPRGSTEMGPVVSPLSPSAIPVVSSNVLIHQKASDYGPSETSDGNQGFTERPPIEVLVKPEPDRTVKRKLKGIHLFVSVTVAYLASDCSFLTFFEMITINGTLGTGLYWRSGQILEIGGPLAVLFSFVLVGLLAWAVMQCVTELLCIWPVPGALSVYVGTFVDHELGIAVGVAYWYATPCLESPED